MAVIEPYKEYQPRPGTPFAEDLPFNVVPFQAAPVVMPSYGQQLVQLDTGQWVLAKVPPAPPVIIAAAPTATERRGLSRTERAAVTIVSSFCAVVLSVGGAIAMAGPYLAVAAQAAIGAAIFLGAGTVAWLALRLLGPLGKVSGSDAAPAAPVNVVNNITVHNAGFLARGNATGVGRIG
jgi:hypothetical protein